MYTHIYIYIHALGAIGSLGVVFWDCVGGDFGESVLKERRSERARLD